MNEPFAATTPALCGLAARALGWRPEHFWNATPAELAASLGLLTGQEPAAFDRATLERLMDTDHDR